MGDYHVRFRERLRVKLPLSTRPKWMCKYQKNNIQKCCMNFVKMSGIDITVYKYPPGGGLVEAARFAILELCLDNGV